MTEPERPAGSFRRLVHELKRRHVPRTLLAYLVGSWIVLQVADVVAPALGLPAWTLTLLVILVLAGLPVAAILSWSYDLTRRGLSRDSPADRTVAVGRAWVVAALTLLVVAAVATGAWFGWSRLRPAPVTLDPDRVAVLPFRVGGADPSVAFLGEGMMDLLAARLGATASPSVVDPRAVLAALARQTPGPAEDGLEPEDHLEAAAELGAGLVVTGEVVGPASNLVIRASLRTTRSGRRAASATAVGPQDSLAAMVERLAVSLLSLQAGEPEQRLPALVGTSVASLRAYLEGRAAFRRGAYADAANHLTRAVDLDSTFALAGYALFRTSGWTVADGDRGFRIAWRNRHRLPRPDRLVVEAQAGPAYPAPSSVRARLEAWSAAVDASRGASQPLMALADLHFHQGARVGIEDWRDRAAAYFEEALRADSLESAALSHLTHLVLASGDTARAAALLDHFVRVDPSSETRLYLEWFLGERRGDRAFADSLRQRLGELPVEPLMYVLGTTVSEGLGLDQGDDIVPHLLRRAATPQEQAFVLEEVYYYEIARGRPAAARSRLAALRELRPELADRLAVVDALYGDGDPSVAEQAAARVAARARGASSVDDLCVQSLWWAWQGETDRAAEGLASLRRPDGRSPADSAHAANCAILLDATLATTTSRPDARATVARADSMLRTGPPLPRVLSGVVANLAVSRLLEATGSAEAALAAARRRPYWAPGTNHLVARSLEREGDLAASQGQENAAIRAYTHYLALRSDPEAALAPQVQRVREAVRRLQGAG